MAENFLLLVNHENANLHLALLPEYLVLPVGYLQGEQLDPFHIIPTFDYLFMHENNNSDGAINALEKLSENVKENMTTDDIIDGALSTAQITHTSSDSPSVVRDILVETVQSTHEA